MDTLPQANKRIEELEAQLLDARLKTLEMSTLAATNTANTNSDRIRKVEDAVTRYETGLALFKLLTSGGLVANIIVLFKLFLFP